MTSKIGVFPAVFEKLRLLIFHCPEVVNIRPPAEPQLGRNSARSVFGSRRTALPQLKLRRILNAGTLNGREQLVLRLSLLQEGLLAAG